MPPVRPESRWRAVSLLRRTNPCAEWFTLANPHAFYYSASVNPLRRFLHLRGALKSLKSIDQRLAEQNTYLRRLADHFAPSYENESPPEIQGVDFLNATEAGLVLDYIDKTQQSTGKVPSDEEILRYLQEEATTAAE